MIIVLNENNQLELTEKAYMIQSFRLLFDSFDNPELAMAHFSFIYYMYNYDSQFLRDIEEEQKRMSEVKKFIYMGSEVKVTRIVKRAMDTYKEIIVGESTSMYLVMRKNVDKLKEFATKMVLFDPNLVVVEYGTILVAGLDFVLVDSKEFAQVNSLLPKQQEELDKFESHLQESIKNKIDIYGGGTLGAYE